MGTSVAGYMIVALAVILYVARLRQRQRRLQEQFEAFQSVWWAQEDRDESRSKARREGYWPCS